MPYDVRKDGSRWCVYKRGESKALGCHETKGQAQRQQRALYAGERNSSAGGSTVSAMESSERNTSTSTSTSGNYELSATGTGIVLSDTKTWTVPIPGFSSQEEESEDVSSRKEWEGVLAVIGHPTSDRRLLIPGEISNRDLPLPFLVQTATEDGHRGAEVAGRIEKITHIPASEFDRADDFNVGDVREGAVIVFAEGTLDGSEHEEDAVRMIENGAGVSIDMPPERVAPFDVDTLEELNPEDLTFEDHVFGNYLTGIAGKIAAATIVSIPAFEEASVALVGDKALVASAYGIHIRKETLTASAAGIAPIKPPSEWFYSEEADEPTPLTVTEDGQVYGHLALWNQCHVGFASCERPPRSDSNYSYFHVGQIETAEGELLNVGRITVGRNGSAKGGHASLVLGRQGAMEHYDASGCVAAFVRAKDGVHGIWLSGSVRSDAPAEKIRDLRANPPSGDWRDYELVAVLSVPVPGFPIPRAEARMVASGAEEDMPVLIATGYAPERIDILTYRRRMRALKSRAREALADAPES